MVVYHAPILAADLSCPGDTPAATKSYDPRYIELAHAMVIHGGSFAARIGEAYLHADMSNRIKLIEAFDDLFQSYSFWLTS